MRPLLGDVLIDLLVAVADAAGDGVVIEDAIIELPLEGTVTVENNRPVLRAGAPHSRFVTGFLPPVHLGRLHIALLEKGEVM